MLVNQFITFKLNRERETGIVRPTEENEKETRAESYIQKRGLAVRVALACWKVEMGRRDIAAPLELPGFYLFSTSRSFCLFVVCCSQHIDTTYACMYT